MSAACYGLMAEFSSPETLLHATVQARREGFEQVEAYAPFPVEGLSEAVGARDHRVAVFALLGGMGGGTAGFLMQYCANVWMYPLDIGGRPYNSWPAFIPITFEMTVLFAALAAALSMLYLNGLPKPYHPVFEVPGFEAASQDGYFLCLRSHEARFERARTEAFLRSLQALSVSEVPCEIE